MSDIVLDSDQERVVDHITAMDFSLLYVIGPPGYGKTAALRKGIRQFYTVHPDKKICVTGTTSVAAVLLSEGGIEATTIHSWLQIGEDSLLMHNETQLTRALEDRNPAAPKDTDMLILDEGSMFTAQNLEILDRVMRRYRGNQNKRFGGMKVVIVGDPMQLPPVPPTTGPGLLRGERPTVTSCIQTLDDHKDVVYAVLSHPHRCDDAGYQGFLRGFISQNRSVRESSMRTLMMQYQRPNMRTPHDVARRALATNASVIAYSNEDVDDCNSAFRAILSTRPSHTFESPVRKFTEEEIKTIQLEGDADVQAEVDAEEDEITNKRKRFFRDGTLHEGQMVQIRSNHTSANGVPVHVGDVCTFTGRDKHGNACMKRKKDGKDIVISKQVAKSEYWKQLEWIGYPFIAANAATVHLTQGNTIQGPVIFFMRSITWDFGGSLPYILYVALSRVTDPDNMVVSHITHPNGVHALASDNIQQALESIWRLEFMGRYPTA
jgi:hypothetical protein